MKTVKRLFIGIGAVVVLLAVLSVTLLNKQAPHMNITLLMREGRLEMEQRNYGQAIDIYRLAIEVDRRYAQAYLSLAEACILDGQPETAEYYLKFGMDNTGSTKVRDAYNSLLEKRAVSDPPG